MTATPKQILPLAVVPVASNDDAPRGTLTMGDIRQRLGIRKTRMVKVETKRPRKVHHMDVAEAAIFPRLFWAIYVSPEFKGDGDNDRLAGVFQADMQNYADLMAPSQWADFRREMDHGADCAMGMMVDWQAGRDGGWQSLKVFAVLFLFMLWVDRHAGQAMFTKDFERAGQDVFAYVRQMHGDAFAAVEPSAHKMLPKIIKRLKACGLFLWLPDYRSDDHE